MSEEEIKEQARRLGLNPKLLLLHEPVWLPLGFGNVREYRFEYRLGEKWSFSFFLSRDDVEHREALAVEFYVNKGLRKLAEKLAA